MPLWILITLCVVGALVVIVAVLSALAPARVEYTETIDINAPRAQVYDDIRLQERLMRWSAWPAETKSTCAVDESHGADGTVGARTVFFTKGKRIGHQEVVGLSDQTDVSMTLVGPGPPHHPELTFTLTQIAPRQTRVAAHFVNRLPRPFNAIWRFAGLSAWTRQMHLKDLQGLKAFSEPPHRDATGAIVGHPPSGENPFQHKATQAA
ncbi:MAG: SRPBCC family protein [Pseudomonadota bacterium]